MVAGVMPKRAAVVAVDVDEDRQALALQVAGDVGELAAAGCSASHQLRHPGRRAASGSASSSMNWYCVRLTVPSMVRSCTGCM